MIPAVQVENLSFRYGEREALAGVSLTVQPGECFGLLGPNGSGKSTLFRILSTLLPPRSGRASVCGHDVATDRALVRRQIGVVFQSPSLDLHLTGRENLRCAGRLYGMSRSQLESRIDACMEWFGVRDRAGDLVKSLSGGLRRRVEIAKCLLHAPAVLLLDEPSTGLDPSARREMWPYLDRVREQSGTAVVLTTHHLDEGDRCDRLAILDRGRIVALGSPRELKQRVGNVCITIDADDAAQLGSALRERLQIKPIIIGHRLRIECADGAAILGEIARVCGGSARSITLGPATLEDVFIHETGRPFQREATEPELAHG